MDDRLIDVAEARARVLAAASEAATGTERVELAAALGRALAEDVASDVDLPPFDVSAMDGYATLAGEAEELRVIDESRAGHPARRAVGAGTAVQISTGAALPSGAEAVVPVERTETIDESANSAVAVPARSPGDHIRRAGEDVHAGTTVLRAGARLGPAEVAVLASVGRAEVACARRPRVAVVVTGDELVAPGAPLGPGQIRDSNAFALAAQAETAGASVVARAIVGDDLDATVETLAGALESADVVCVSGGVSVGPHDHVKAALTRLGVDERFWRVALKPGKPTWFGVRDSSLVFGLPGNPVSAMVTFHLFVRPALERMAGLADHGEGRTVATLDVPVAREPHRDQAIRCELSLLSDGWHVRPTGPQGSHILTSMLRADALALVTAGEGEIAAGERVGVDLVRAAPRRAGAL